jgi:hypothetical protein
MRRKYCCTEDMLAGSRISKVRKEDGGEGKRRKEIRWAWWVGEKMVVEGGNEAEG